VVTLAFVPPAEPPTPPQPQSTLRPESRWPAKSSAPSVNPPTRQPTSSGLLPDGSVAFVGELPA